MREQGSSASIARLATFPAWVACALACVAGLGYAMGSVTLIAFQAGWQAMAPLTALGIAAVAVPLT